MDDCKWTILFNVLFTGLSVLLLLLMFCRWLFRSLHSFNSTATQMIGWVFNCVKSNWFTLNHIVFQSSHLRAKINRIKLTSEMHEKSKCWMKWIPSITIEIIIICQHLLANIAFIGWTQQRKKPSKFFDTYFCPRSWKYGKFEKRFLHCEYSSAFFSFSFTRSRFVFFCMCY